MRRRSEESPRTDGGVPAPSSALSKRVVKQSREVGTVRPQTADFEPREGALTAESRKADRVQAGEIRHLSWMPVPVIDRDGKRLAPCHPARARELLDKGMADVAETCPFVIRLRRVIETPVVEKMRINLDTGSKHLGFAVRGESGQVYLMGQVDQRTDIHERLEWRRAARRSRRSRNTRYRKPRFDNRTRPEGWLPPSLEHRVDAAVKLVKRLARYLPIKEAWVETAGFDTQKLMDPAIESRGYQEGALFRTTLRRYLDRKHKGNCAYCGKDLGPDWQADHVVPKSCGGSDRPMNRVAACRPCNEKKGSMTAEEFGHPEVLAQAKEWYAPAAIVSSIKTALVKRISDLMPVTETDGVQTCLNRRKLALEKTHANDAACLIEVPKQLILPAEELRYVLRAAGTRRLVNGPRGEHAMRLPREVKGFRQWDQVKWKGRLCYVKGRRKTGSFLLSDLDGKKVKDGAGYKSLTLVRRRSTFQGILIGQLEKEAALHPRPKGPGFRAVH